MAHNRNYGKSKHTEPFRVVTDSFWPRGGADNGGTHNARYYDRYEDALLAYMHSVTNQMFDKTFCERASFDRRNEHDGRYYPMFESFQHHTIESYGLKPDDAQ